MLIDLYSGLGSPAGFQKMLRGELNNYEVSTTCLLNMKKLLLKLYTVI